MANVFKNDKSYINEEYIGNIAPITKDQLKIFLHQLEKYVCKIIGTNKKKATGFLCKIPYPDQFRLLPVLMTCYHVLNKKDIINNEYIKITFDDDKIEKMINLKEPRKVFEKEELDTFIIEIKPNIDKIYDFLDIDENVFDNNYNQKYRNITAYVLQYSKGIISSFSVGLINDISGININHLCSTDFGSSGAPIFNLSNFKVFGIHKGRTKLKYNQATFIKYVIEQFNKENFIFQNQKTERNINKKDVEIFNNSNLHNNKNQINLEDNGFNLNINKNMYNSYNHIDNSIINNTINNSMIMKIDDLHLIKYLGKNSLTDFYLAHMEENNKFFFTKKIKRKYMDEDIKITNKIYYQIKVLKILNHPNIFQV